METTIHNVQTKAFEGPIELLLRLIEQRKLPISEISIAEVTDDYIKRIRGFEDIGLHNVTQFIVVASTLVLIKSRTLLPLLQLTDEEEESIDDLEKRLKMYRLFQDLGIKLAENFMVRPVLPRPYVARGVVFSPDKKITTENMLESMQSVLGAIPKKEQLPATSVKKVIHIEELMDSLVERVQEGIQLSFNQFVQKGKLASTPEEAREAKTYVVVGFLAMLEMVRNGIIEVLQGQNFDDISIEKI